MVNVCVCAFSNLYSHTCPTLLTMFCDQTLAFQFTIYFYCLGVFMLCIPFLFLFECLAYLLLGKPGWLRLG